MTIGKLFLTGFGVMVLALGLSACESKGPAERAGERIDEAAEQAGEALEPEGPGERAGEQIDRAMERGGEALEGAGDRAKENTQR